MIEAKPGLVHYLETADLTCDHSGNLWLHPRDGDGDQAGKPRLAGCVDRDREWTADLTADQHEQADAIRRA